MEKKEIVAYIRRFHRDYGVSHHPLCPACGKEIHEEDADQLEASNSREGVVLIHKKCYKREVKPNV